MSLLSVLYILWVLTPAFRFRMKNAGGKLGW